MNLLRKYGRQSDKPLYSVNRYLWNIVTFGMVLNRFGIKEKIKSIDGKEKRYRWERKRKEKRATGTKQDCFEVEATTIAISRRSPTRA